MHREKIATGIAIAFHVIGLAGIFFYDQELFAAISWANLLLMFLLIIYTQEKLHTGFVSFLVLCFTVGMLVEIAGTSTGMFFGDYYYTDVLGKKILDVPLIIGINWFIIIYCAATAMSMLANRLHRKIASIAPPWLKAVTIITDTAVLAVFLDWILEPAAIKLNFWQWRDGTIPAYNYISWFVVSALLAATYYWLVPGKDNKFAVNLLLIQVMFFLIIRTFL